MKCFAFIVLGISLALTVGSVAGAQKEINLPAETATLLSLELPGSAVATQKCTICHSADYVSYQPPGMSQAQWTAEVGKMQHAYGAPLNDTEVKVIGAYLAVAYGSAKATDASVLAVSAETSHPPPNATSLSTVAATEPASIDVKALLNSNGCLGCHSIDKKLVGPAYHDVAAKYSGDAQAMTKLVVNIRQGGVGRWGQVPMPPFAGLSDAEARALAGFVLKQ